MKERLFFKNRDGSYALYSGDVRETLCNIKSGSFDMVFADPPYFLSNGGFSVQAGKKVSVDKGDWDRSKGRDEDRRFTMSWLKLCRDVLKESGTIWVCGTYHNIFTVADVMAELNFKVLNVVTWQKSNPPPNLCCRYFTHSTEFLIWARKNAKVSHRFNYEIMHRLAGSRQMTDVWRMPSIAPWEKTCGKHPAQKPIALVARAILACTDENDVVLDPFSGSGTTGIAANLLGRRFVGVEKETAYLEMSSRRRMLFEEMHDSWRSKIADMKCLNTVGGSCGIITP